MAMTAAEVLKMAKDNEVKFVDFRFADTRIRAKCINSVRYFLFAPNRCKFTPRNFSVKTRTCNFRINCQHIQRCSIKSPRYFGWHGFC